MKKLKGWDKKNNRPVFCFDKSCKVVYSTFQQEHFDDGYSFFCYGKLKKPHLFFEKKAKHLNQLSHCYYTPLKGMIRFFVTIGDLWGEIQAKLAVMNKVSPLGNCCKCKKKLYRIVKSCIVLTKKKKLCYECKDEEKLADLFNFAIDIRPKKIPKFQIHRIWGKIKMRLN